MTNNKFQQGTVATIFGWLLLFVLVPNVLVLIISFLTENRQSAYLLISVSVWNLIKRCLMIPMRRCCGTRLKCLRLQHFSA